ncbi:MAG: hypothetical protein AAB214_14745 [Fibrobacterota bacterium]
MKILGLPTILIASVAIQAAEPSGVVLLDFQSKGILDKAVLRQLWERSQSIASGIPSADLLSADETRKRIFDGNVLLASRCDEACYQRVATKLGAKELVVPTVEKAGDQLKFTFLRVRGSNGQKLQEATVWSDGRVGRALTSALFKVFTDDNAGTEITIPAAAWTSAGIAAAGIGLTVWMGYTKPVTQAESKPPVF